MDLIDTLTTFEIAEASHWKHSKAPATSGVHPGGVERLGVSEKTRNTRLRAIEKKKWKGKVLHPAKGKVGFVPEDGWKKLNPKHWTKISLTERHANCIYNTL